MNLREENEGVNIILKQAINKSERINFQSFEYGLILYKTSRRTTKEKEKI